MKNRVLFQSALKKQDEEQVREMHQQMTDAVEDQLCLAAVHSCVHTTRRPLIPTSASSLRIANIGR